MSIVRSQAVTETIQAAVSIVGGKTIQPMNKDVRILVTGATGFVGSYILRSLIHAGYQNVSALHRESSDFSLVAEIKEEVRWICCDLMDLPGLEEAAVDQQIVVHAAALVSFQPWDRKRLNKVNVEGTANMVNVARAADVGRFIHISSVGVFPRKHPGETIDETVEWSDSKLNTDYAISKYYAELEVWRGAAEGLEVTILNPSLVIGSGFWNSGSASLFKQVYRGLRFYPKGSTGVVDARDVGLAVVKSLSASVGGERIIISGENLSYRQILDQISEHFKRRKPTIKLNAWILELALLKYRLSTFFGIRAKVLSRASLHNSQHKWFFDHSKSVRELQLQYRPVSACISETCQQFEKAQQMGLPPMCLPL